MRRRGFTGTRNPPASARDSIRLYLMTLSPMVDELVIGCCVGVDQIVGREGRKLGFKVHGIVPANRSQVPTYYRDFCTTTEHMPDDTDYMDRNQRIVDVSVDLTAFPLDSTERQRSGTWATVRRARKANKPVIILPLS